MADPSSGAQKQARAKKINEIINNKIQNLKKAAKSKKAPSSNSITEIIG